MFPVPDGDTGSNLALTLRAMADAINGFRENSVARVASRLAEAGVVGARGNSGMMLSRFFLGFADGLAGRERAGPMDLAAAMRQASESLYRAVDQPIEGTILTVVRESTEELERFSPHAPDLETLAQRLLLAARESLERTPSLLPVLREANVVDAGAKGYVRFVEGIVALIEGQQMVPAITVAVPSTTPDIAAMVEYPEDSDRAFRYCTEFIVRGTPPPARREIAEAVRSLGGSLIVNRATTVAKIHIHTDDPARVEELLAQLGSDVERVKAEDMRAQHRRRRQMAARRIAIVTDSTCDLPPETIIERDITVAPLTVMFGDEAFHDQVDLTHEEFLARLQDPALPLPTTSQPAPMDFERSYERASENGDQVLGVFLSGALSGTLGQARNVADRIEGKTIRIFDSRTASLGLGFQVLKASEMASEGYELDEIVAELERIRDRSGLYLTVDTLSYLQRSGRVGAARAFLGNLLDLKPVLSVNKEGAVVPVGRARGREALVPLVVDLLKERVPAERSRLRMGVVHVACSDVAEELAAEFEREFRPDEILVRPVASVIAAHTGPGAWGVFYQAE